MAIMIVTNNPKVADDMEEACYDYIFLNQQAQAALLLARDLILEGWRLAADPLAGYNRRYNPYHTVFLTDDSDNDLAEDVLRLERAANHLNDPRRPKSENIFRIIKDYQELDYSLAKATLVILRKYRNYKEKGRVEV